MLARFATRPPGVTAPKVAASQTLRPVILGLAASALLLGCGTPGVRGGARPQRALDAPLQPAGRRAWGAAAGAAAGPRRADRTAQADGRHRHRAAEQYGHERRLGGRACRGRLVWRGKG